MASVNIQTWARVTRIDLQHLSIGLGNAVVADRLNWPSSGEGRQVKAATERATRMLEATFDRDIQHVFDTLADVAVILNTIHASNYFQTNISNRPYTNRAGEVLPFSNALEGTVKRIGDFAERNRPQKLHRPSQVMPADSALSKTDGVVTQKTSVILRSITPAQQDGPLQFVARNGVLQLKSQSSKPDPLDLKNIRSARLALKESSTALLQSMLESNCDPRLIEAVKEIDSIMQSKADVIRLGLVNLSCDQLFERFQDEIPDIAISRFKGLGMAIRLYVAQFPEWQRFTENAARSDFDPVDVQKTYDLGKQLLPKLKAAPSLVDPKVPKSIELVLEALQTPDKSGRRALYGAVRTLENLLARIFTECAGLLDATFKGIRGGVTKGATVAVATALLLAAAHTAGLLSPTAERVLKATWMKQAADLISKSRTIGP